MARPSVERAAARIILSLPPPLLRLMSGGGVIYRGGRTLDPQLQFLAADSRRRPALHTLDLEEARRSEVRAVATLTGRPEPGVTWENLTLPGAAGPINARAYRPAVQDRDAPLLVWAHMGGGVIGTLETSHTFCTLLARIARGPILSIDYRLAPEHRFPAGLEDMLAAYRWARDHSERFGARGGRVAVGGDSIGGSFAAIICQELKRNAEPQPLLQLLIYPCTDAASEGGSMSLHSDAFPLSRPMMDWFLAHYLDAQSDPAEPRLSPLRTQELAGLAPAVIATAGFDPLADQGEAYARRLRSMGVPVTYRCYDGLTHAFTAFTGGVVAADAACREIATLVRDAFEAQAT